MSIDWVNYFSSRRSNLLNVMVGIWISFVFGLTSILASEATSTVLAFITFFILAIILTIHFFPKYHFFKAWEKYSLNNANIISESMIKNFNLSKYPTPDDNLNEFLNKIKTKSSLELFLQCAIWGGFIVLLLLWKNDIVQELLFQVSQTTNIHSSYEILNTQDLDIGLRHFFFIWCLFFSICVFLFKFFSEHTKIKPIYILLSVFILIFVYPVILGILLKWLISIKFIGY